MPTFVRHGGAWRTPNGVFVRVGGVWQRVTLVYTKVGGVWRQTFADQFSFTLSGSLNDVNLRSAALSAGWNGIASVVATVAGGAVLNATFSYGLTIDGSFPNGVVLVNNGIIAGRGGNGGAGGDGRGNQGTPINPGTLGIAYDGAAGGNAGHGLLAQVPVTIFNNGIIAGGGGGGGGGGAAIANQLVDDNPGGGK